VGAPLAGASVTVAGAPSFGSDEMTDSPGALRRGRPPLFASRPATGSTTCGWGVGYDGGVVARTVLTVVAVGAPVTVSE
jgi:hypothetical protein